MSMPMAATAVPPVAIRAALSALLCVRVCVRLTVENEHEIRRDLCGQFRVVFDCLQADFVSEQAEMKDRRLGECIQRG